MKSEQASARPRHDRASLARPRHVAWVLMAGWLALGCKSSDSSSSRAAPPAPSAAGLSVSSSAEPSAPPVASVLPTGHLERLPKLKPTITKPFPEGADEATVCEAIDSKEPDLWMRFGHILPAYMMGAVYVFETGPESKQKLERYISRDYVYRYGSYQASCRGRLTLLYIRKMFEVSEYNGKPFGRVHLSESIEKKLGIKTRESFLLKDDVKRLDEYCRADAVLCDRLLRLNDANRDGLCAFAVGKCTHTDDVNEEAKLLAACHQLPLAGLACVQFQKTSRETDICREQVRRALCPPEPASLEPKP